MATRDINTKSLLSQNEVEALLEVFNEHHDKPHDVVFELAMAKVAKNIGHYLETLGLTFSAIKVVKQDTREHAVFSYAAKGKYLDSLFLQNTLANAIVAKLSGAKGCEFDLQRALSSLETALMEEIVTKIVYMVEKELDSYFSNHVVTEVLDTYRIVLMCGELQGLLYFSFVSNDSRSMPQRVKTVAVGTKVEIVLGELLTDIVLHETLYPFKSYQPKHLILDGRYSFQTQNVGNNGDMFTYTIGEASEQRLDAGRYYLVSARGYLDDEMLLNLKKGSLVDLHSLEELELHKDGKIAAVAELYAQQDRLMVKIRSLDV